jgi:hypothetical protein
MAYRRIARTALAAALLLGLAAPIALAQETLAPDPSASPAAQPLQTAVPMPCNWVGTLRTTPQQVGESQVILRMRVDQDLVTPDAVHKPEETVQFNYSYGSTFLNQYSLRPGGQVDIRGFVRQGGQCVVDTLNVGTLAPGYEGYARPVGACLTAGVETISVAEKATTPLGCAVGPQVSTRTPTQAFQGGRMLYLGGIYALQVTDPSAPTGGGWSGVRDPYREVEPETAGLTPPADGLFEPKRGFGKAWRESYGGPDGQLGWATEDEQTIAATWQQFENGIVIVARTGEGFILYYDGRSWEQKDR